MNLFKKLALAFVTVAILAACNDEDVTPMESATFEVTIENLAGPFNYLNTGTIGFLEPGQDMTFSFNAGQGHYLSFATMFVQSNDLFYGFSEQGLRLYDDEGNAITGDVTNEIDLWDAGTEVNEEPGVGANQAPRQSGPNTGVDENGTLQLIENIGDGYTYPSDESIIQIVLEHDGGTQFTATLRNVSGSSSLPTPFAPGVWAVHGGDVQLFTTGEAAPEGLEGVAEDGANETLAGILSENTGYASPLAPGVFAVHAAGDTPLFENNAADFGQGLEALAEDGDASILGGNLENAANVIQSGIFDTPSGASAAGPALPGASYSFTFEANDGEYLNFATMLVQTNDLFFAFGENGLALFKDGTPVSGDITTEVSLWDAGTEVNEYPGAGKYQPVRGGGDSGPAENGNVQIVNDAFDYPAVTDLVRVTISVQ